MAGLIYVVVPDDDAGEEKALEAETLSHQTDVGSETGKGWRCISHLHHVEGV